MSQRTIRRIAVLEPACIFLLIMAYIWVLRFAHHWAWVDILALMVVSHRLRREDAAVLGFRWSNLPECLARFGPALTFAALLLFAAGMLLDTTRRVHVDQAFLSWTAYVPWGIFQQYILNGYFLTRFDAAVSRRTASALAAALFAGAHTPNWFLMAVTLLLGYCCTILYRRHKNLYFLGIAHGTVGFLLYLVVPDSITHHLNVGPGWFR
jgi:membrane protease YdiL (CAAX protease family)